MVRNTKASQPDRQTDRQTGPRSVSDGTSQVREQCSPAQSITGTSTSTSTSTGTSSQYILYCTAQLARQHSSTARLEYLARVRPNSLPRPLQPSCTDLSHTACAQLSTGVVAALTASHTLARRVSRAGRRRHALSEAPETQLPATLHRQKRRLTSVSLSQNIPRRPVHTAPPLAQRSCQPSNENSAFTASTN